MRRMMPVNGRVARPRDRRDPRAGTILSAEQTAERVSAGPPRLSRPSIDTSENPHE